MDRFRLHSDTRSQHGAAGRGVTQPSGRALDSFPNLIDSRFDQDSCGVGFVAQLSGEPSHAILNHALTALARLEHRGAVAADGKSSDGVGVTVVIPRQWLLAQTGVILPDWKPLGVGVIFLSGEDAEPRAEIESALRAQGMEALLWRPVPV